MVQMSLQLVTTMRQQAYYETHCCWVAVQMEDLTFGEQVWDIAPVRCPSCKQTASVEPFYEVNENYPFQPDQ